MNGDDKRVNTTGYSGTVEEIKARCDIVEVVGRRVALKRAGSNYKGLCPFHNEKTPSFMVSQEKQIFTCFGCGATGDVIEFVKRSENLSFPEAVEKLAEELGIKLQPRQGKNREKTERLYEISTQCARHFYRNLRKEDNPGLRYMVKRGIDPQTARKFGIGYAPSQWRELTDFMESQGVQPELLEQLGLCAKGNHGYYDKFRGRLIFPIFNARGKVIGFGGRAIEEGASPKYLNSSESPIFQKKHNLYGLNLAKGEIARQNLAILVEGYMDVVSLVKHGVENVVATLGTALTPQQAALLKRYTDRVVLSYDSDSAGQAAAMRGMDILQQAGLEVRIVVIPTGKDPDEYIKANGKEAFIKLTEQAISFMEYKIRGIKKKYDMNTTEGSIRFLEEIARELKKIQSPVKRAAYINQVASLTGIPSSSLTREVEGMADEPEGPPAARQKEASVESRKQHRQRQERYTPLRMILIRLLKDHQEYGKKAQEEPLVEALFAESPYEGLYRALLSWETEPENPQSLEEALEEEQQALLREVMERVPRQSEPEKVFSQCLEKLHKDKLSARRKQILEIMQILNEEEDQKEIQALSKELMEISRVLK